MKNFFADVTFDFDDQYVLEKEVFLDILSNENWINLDSECNWRVGFNQPLNTEDKIEIIRQDLIVASKISKIKSVDFAIILKDAVYVDKL